MKLLHALSAFITAGSEESLPKRTTNVLIPSATLGTTCILALTTLTAAGHRPLPQQLAETLATEASNHAGVNIQAAVQAGIMLYVGEAVVMSIMEKLMKPLIAAGEERGKAQADFEAWKQDQRDKGVIFVEDDEGETSRK